ncbi:unnamed protein product [Trichogramma brassicae]|uniref:Uncharacterized protein n=1 Tax=Trichogramma brassicae TaxID=86971 RepID=A0A6H5HZU7_9HYME|nr:unnamed protein product [Trichogramma brassicae]
MNFSEIAFTIVEGDVRVNGIGTRSVRLGMSDFSTDVCPCGLCSPSFMAVAMPRVARAFGVRTTARGKHSHKRAVLSPTPWSAEWQERSREVTRRFASARKRSEPSGYAVQRHPHGLSEASPRRTITSLDTDHEDEAAGGQRKATAE